MKESFGFDIDPKEWEEVIRMAKDLPAKIGQEAFGSTLDDGIESIVSEMKKNIEGSAENPTGLLERSLVTKRKKKYEPTFWHRAVGVNVGKKRGDGAFYWNIVEHGHKIVTPSGKDTGRKVKAMKYAILAFESKKNGIKNTLTSKTKTLIEKHFNKKVG